MIEVAKALVVTVEAIKNFSEKAVLNIIGNTFQDYGTIITGNYNCTINPLDKVVELYERLVLAEKKSRVFRKITQRKIDSLKTYLF